MNDRTLLSSIARNAGMGIEGIAHLCAGTRDEEFRALLHRQSREYRTIAAKADQLLRSVGKKPKKPGFGARAGAFVSTSLNTMADPSTQHRAQMMIEGTSIGIAKLIRERNDAKRRADVSENVLSLASDLIETEEKNVGELKRFL